MKKYLNKEIENYGVYTSPEYEQFQKDYKKYLKNMCKRNNWELADFSPNHYNFCAVIKSGNNYCYFSISDVRYWKNEWYNHILIRKMRHEKDWTGMENCYTSLPDAEKNISKILRIGYC